MRSSYIIGIFCFLSILGISLVSLGYDGITGNVVFEPGVANECDPVALASIWGSIFLESPIGITIYNNSFSSGEDCASYIMFKNNSNNNIYVVLRGDVASEQKTWAYVVHGDESLSNSLNSISDYASGVSFVANGLLNTVNIVDRNVSNASAAQTNFESSFTFSSPGLFSSFEDGYRFIEIDSLEGGGPDKAITGHVVALESINYIEFINYTNFEEISFESNISNYTFEIDSGLNFAFDFRNHFDYGDDATLGVSSWGINNTGGEYIDFDLNGDDARFRPKEDFLGSRDFVVFVNSSHYSEVSNQFRVSIVNELPEAPKIYREFETLFLKSGQSLVIDLEDHFTDSDSTSINYNSSEGDLLNISISGSILTIFFRNNFTTFDSFFINAGDGVLSVTSDEIFVFLEDRSFGDLVGDVSPLDVTENLSLEFELDNETNSSSSEESNLFGVSSENMLWIIIGTSIIIGVIIIGFLIYWIFRKRPPIEEKPELVNSYLEKLKSRGEVTSFSSIPTRVVKRAAPKIIKTPLKIINRNKVAAKPVLRPVQSNPILNKPVVKPLNKLANLKQAPKNLGLDPLKKGLKIGSFGRVVPKRVVPKDFYKGDALEMYNKDPKAINKPLTNNPKPVNVINRLKSDKVVRKGKKIL